MFVANEYREIDRGKRHENPSILFLVLVYGGKVMANAINVIYLYKYKGMWIFDDEKVGLDKESFVEGADAIIDQALALKDIKDPENAYDCKGNT